MTHACTIHYIDNTHTLDILNLDSIQILVDAALADNAKGSPHHQLNIMFVDPQESTALHQEHFNDHSSTDVMSFPDNSYDPHTQCMHLGDLAICVQVAETSAAQRGLSTSEEIMLYIIHGLLHIVGYDDHDPQERLEMWNKQKQLMALLDIEISDN